MRRLLAASADELLSLPLSSLSTNGRSQAAGINARTALMVGKRERTGVVALGLYHCGSRSRGIRFGPSPDASSDLPSRFAG